jgi:hypothetical protein
MCKKKVKEDGRARRREGTQRDREYGGRRSNGGTRKERERNGGGSKGEEGMRAKEEGMDGLRCCTPPAVRKNKSQNKRLTATAYPCSQNLATFPAFSPTSSEKDCGSAPGERTRTE